MNMKSENLIHQDALWRAYVNADPDLRRLEQRKRAIAHRRMVREKARREREEAKRAIICTLIELAKRAAVLVLWGLAFFLFMGYACLT